MSNPDQTAPDNAVFSIFTGDNPDVIANPFSLLAQTRAVNAVVPMPFSLSRENDHQAWMVTRMEEAVQVLKDHAHFTVDPRNIGITAPFGHEVATADDPSEALTFINSRNSMLTVDEPDHRRLRRLVSKAFTPKYMEGLRPRVQQIADTLLDQVQAQGSMDLVKDYAFPLPINVISEMLGVPQADHAQIRVWSEGMARGLSMGERDPEVMGYMRAFGAYTANLVAEKRLHPADDLISQLIAIEEEEDRLDSSELISMITLLIFAGHETTSNLIATGTMMLLERPDQLEKLKADLSLVPSAVEELLRFNGPATMTGPRFATADIEIAGQPIKRGDMVIAVLLSANRDESQFTQPEELDIARTLNRHIAFGQGIHVCLGAPLARLEGDVAFTTLLKRMPNLRLSVPHEDIAWHFALNSRSLATLPVAF